MSLGNVTTRTVVAVLVALFAALIFRSWLQLELLESGTDRYFAADLSYLVVPPIMALLLFPLWRSEKSFLASRLSPRNLTGKIAFQAVAIGILLRLLWWSQLIVGVSFGLYRSDDAQAIVGPQFSFQCDSPMVFGLGLAVMALTVPLIEEFVHRGYVVSYLKDRGPRIAILVSALAFMIFHSQHIWWFAFLAGLVFGCLYWHTCTLWPSLLAHMTINGIAQLDWRCVSGAWNPVSADLPLLLPGTIAAALVIACGIGILMLLSRIAAEHDSHSTTNAGHSEVAIRSIK